MRYRFWMLPVIPGMFLMLPGVWGQDGAVVPALAVKPIVEPSPGARDLNQLTPEQRHFYLSAKSGMEWLQRVNKTDGRFVPGFEPALRVTLEGDDYLHQAGAATALARSATYFKDDRAAAVAKQALLTLLLETNIDAKTGARFTAAPEAFLNRLATAGTLASAIHELANPAADLVQNGDQLVHYLRLQQQADGSFLLGADDATAQAALIEHCTGAALQGLMRSHAQRPEPWKLDAVRKACRYYHAWWRQHKNLPMIPQHTAAYAEAYLATKDKALADAVFEMNDWLCTLQYGGADPRRMHWAGGFPPWQDGKATSSAPTIRSAVAAESLVEACRVARAAGDAARLQRYKTALANCLRFVTTLQYTEANTQHFAERYRQSFLEGGFFQSHQEGNLRIEYTEHALAALVQHLRYGLE